VGQDAHIGTLPGRLGAVIDDDDLDLAGVALVVLAVHLHPAAVDRKVTEGDDAAGSPAQVAAGGRSLG